MTVRSVHLQILGHHVHIRRKELRQRYEEHSLSLYINVFGLSLPS